MAKTPGDLEERTTVFAESVRQLVREAPRTLANYEDLRQLVRSSGSVPANCVEANEALGPKDRVMHFKIARKEAKECQLWLRLMDTGPDSSLARRRTELQQEALELKLILTAIIKKLE